MQNWVASNKETFERDVLHDFCLAAHTLEEQFDRFAETGTLSYPIMRELVGDLLNKGLLWRLKDKAHHIFREQDSQSPQGAMLDWALGYIFHESSKLTEDSHLRQYYVPRLAAFSGPEHPPASRALLDELIDVKQQTKESIKREISRLQTLLGVCRSLFIQYFAGRAGHRPLARLLHDSQALIQGQFRGDYPLLLHAVYNNEPERIHIEAAHSLMESARLGEALKAVRAALAVNPFCPAALALQEELTAKDG